MMDEQIKQPFKIYQISKLKGIRSKLVYQTNHFVSPMFGKKVKDVVAVPIEIKDERDKTKSFDAFRTNKKLTEEDAIKKYGTKYYEFSNFITKETRQQFFGTDATHDEDQYETQDQPKMVQIRPIVRVVHEKDDFEDINIEQPNHEPIEEKTHVFDVTETETIPQEPQLADLTPDESDEEEITIQSSFFGQQNDVKDTPKQDKPEVSEDTEVSEPEVKHMYGEYKLPSVTMFEKSVNDTSVKPDWLNDQVDVINKTLLDFGIDGVVIESKKGPTVTRHEISLEAGVNVKKVNNIQDNLMMDLAATSVRIEAPIPGKPYVGIEVPNVEKEIVCFGSIIDDERFLDEEHPLKVALGMDIDGEHIYADIGSMPHGLIAGATNSGKSVCINTVLASLLIKNTPDDLKLILIDPKMVELTPYNDIPHLLTPVITDAKVASQALDWVVNEMERRFQIFANSRSRNIQAFNKNVSDGIVNEDKMPYIVIIIDELGDLMTVASREVETSIQRITQKARAAGIHLIVATQRPTTDVIKGTIKSNIPVRIAFKVASFVDSTTILDGAGAETLLGRGDMLFKTHETPKRLQGAWIKDDEIYDLIEYVKKQRQPEFAFGHDELKRKIEKQDSFDPLFEEIATFVVEQRSCSINSIQKEFNLGFNRAQSVVSSLIDVGVVEYAEGTKAKEVRMTLYELEELLKELYE